jgi:hypothetical protein
MYSFLSIMVVIVEMKEPATPFGHGWLGGWYGEPSRLTSSVDGFTFGGEAVDLVTNERPEIAFAFDEEPTANPSELVRPMFCHL